MKDIQVAILHGNLVDPATLKLASEVRIEALVNKWLSENEQVEVEDIKLSTTPDGTVIAMIIYYPVKPSVYETRGVRTF